MEAVNVAVTGKSKADIKTEETNRMIKLLSIASGKTTAEQEAEAGSIPYSQYIKQKEAEQNKNTAENSGADGENSAEVSSMGGVDDENSTADDMYADSFSDEKRAKKRERVETLADKLGLKLNWSSEVTEGKYNPKTREVTLNPNLTAGRMYMFIFSQSI
ncbi:MAG: hypothetical protein U0L72_01185 [Acutalibacteraceae bacterium]|nr:hypothetical protein [Acutalibacteraceae bacterium]